MGSQQSLFAEISDEFIDIIETPAKRVAVMVHNSTDENAPANTNAAKVAAPRSPQRGPQTRPKASQTLARNQAQRRLSTETVPDAPLHLYSHSHPHPHPQSQSHPQPQKRRSDEFKPLPRVDTSTYRPRCSYGKRKPHQILRYAQSCEGNRFITNDEL